MTTRLRSFLSSGIAVKALLITGAAAFILAVSVAISGAVVGAFLLGLVGTALLLAGAWWRTKRFLVAGIISCLLSFVLWDSTCPIFVADGEVRVALQFSVVDASTMAPVQRAIVRVRRIVGSENPDVLAPGGKLVTDGPTDEHGTVTLSCSIPCSEVVRRYSRTIRVGVPYDLWLEVIARGYRPRLVNLHNLTGGSRRYQDLPFQAMKVTLESRVETEIPGGNSGEITGGDSG